MVNKIGPQGLHIPQGSFALDHSLLLLVLARAGPEAAQALKGLPGRYLARSLLHVEG